MPLHPLNESSSRTPVHCNNKSYHAGKQWVQSRCHPQQSDTFCAPELWHSWVRQQHPCLTPYLSACTTPNKIQTPDALFTYQSNRSNISKTQIGDVVGNNDAAKAKDPFHNQDKQQIFDATHFMLSFAPQHPLTEALFRKSIKIYFTEPTRTFSYRSNKPLYAALIHYYQEGSCAPTLHLSLDQHSVLPNFIGGFEKLQEVTIDGYHPRSNLDSILQDAWPSLEVIHLSTGMPLGIIGYEQRRLKDIRPDLQWTFSKK